jgi:hypothetical protein
MKKFRVFGERSCTYCGHTMLFIDYNSQPMGLCLRCDNTDYCDNETEEDVKKRYGERLRQSKYKFMEM